MSVAEVRLPRNLQTAWNVDQLNSVITQLWQEFHALRDSLVTVLYAEPIRLYEGLFAFADGTEWDPGSGRGLYQYVSGAWEKL